MTSTFTLDVGPSDCRIIVSHGRQLELEVNTPLQVVGMKNIMDDIEVQLEVRKVTNDTIIINTDNSG